MAKTGKCALCGSASNGKSGGSRERCERCAKLSNTAAQNRWRAANRETVNATQRAWRAKNKDKLNANKREWARLNPEINRENKRRHVLKKSYGLTPLAVEAMRARQDGRCAICEVATDKLKIDHSHATGKVRELLCNSCNIGLGAFRDSPGLLLAAERYVQRHSDNPSLTTIHALKSA